MSKIHAHINDSETPEAVKNLLQEFVREFESRSSDVWIREVKNTGSDYHRKTLLKQGRLDFDNPTHDLTSEELICLYNYYYFPMHFQSSYDLFGYLWEKGFAKHFIHNFNPIIIDYGCGTLSSTIALSLVFQEKRKEDIFLGYNIQRTEDERHSYPIYNPITMLYYDTSSSVLKYTDTLFNTKYLATEYDINLWQYSFYGRKIINPTELIKALDDVFYCKNISYYYIYKERHYEHVTEPLSIHHSKFSLIFNFCYLFASTTLNIEELSRFITLICTKYNHCNICIFFQNPNLDELNTKWKEFKEKVPLKSIAKGVAPIKHYGNSKVRYEVLFKSMFDDVFSDVEISIKKK